MNKEKSSPSAKETLNTLAILLSQETEEAVKISSHEESFLSNAMDIVNIWRTESKLEIGRKRQKRFEEFAKTVRQLLQTNFDEQAVYDSNLVNPALQGAFFRKLTQLSKQTKKTVLENQELLKLWSEYCKEDKD